MIKPCANMSVDMGGPRQNHSVSLQHHSGHKKAQLLHIPLRARCNVCCIIHGWPGCRWSIGCLWFMNFVRRSHTGILTPLSVFCLFHFPHQCCVLTARSYSVCVCAALAVRCFWDVPAGYSIIMILKLEPAFPLIM